MTVAEFMAGLRRWRASHNFGPRADDGSEGVNPEDLSGTPEKQGGGGGSRPAGPPALVLAIASELACYPEVRWDRFVLCGTALRVYGWLDRDDGRADFLLLDFDISTGGVRDWITSAHPHPASVVERLENESSVKCRRVEDYFDVPNAVRLQPDPPQLRGEACRRCGHSNAIWAAPSPLWNAVIRGGSLDGEPEYSDLVCAACFMELAEEKGIATRFRVTAEEINVELEKITPTGRVWDEDRWLWVQPDPPPGELEKLADEFERKGRHLRAERDKTSAPNAWAAFHHQADASIAAATRLRERAAELPLTTSPDQGGDGDAPSTPKGDTK